VNCAAIPEALLESELFGHEKGAFTGAARARAGRFALAEGGTIFLDEVGELPLALQPKLLRVLQDHSFEPLGAGRARQADFRLIAATHRNLETLVAGGQFREDLYYRLAVLPVHVPALRERPGDVPALGRHFLWRAAERMGVEVRPLGPEAEAALCGEPWPGNVRQLENAMERLAVLCSSRAQPQCGSCPGRIVAECIPGARGTRPPPGAPPALPESGVDLNLALREMEARLIREALQRTAGNKERAAKLLGLNRTTLVEKIKRSALAPAAPIPRGPSKI
jgi:sigma-54 specific flagellar transcriptional regulator A